MMHVIKRTTLFVVIAAITLLALPTAAQNGNVVLNNNSGTGVSTWFISGESSLVMNGFDLGPLNIELPTQITRVSIDIERAVPGQNIEVVIYQDSTGGSPIDATLVNRQQVNIQQAGIFTLEYEQPVEITAPVVWIGFYLPVDFEFRADTSGSSVLTYWAWEPGSTFDLANLSSASVFGPADGRAPVNIDMGGIARITAELSAESDGTTPSTTSPSRAPAVGSPVPRDEDGRVIGQLLGSGNVDFSVMLPYTNCTNLYYDREDIQRTYRDGVDIYCQLEQPMFYLRSPEGYSRGGVIYDVYIFGVESGATRLPHAITHCIRPQGADIDRALFGLAYGAPREWEILPTVRFGELICAELNYMGSVAYFLPTN